MVFLKEEVEDTCTVDEETKFDLTESSERVELIDGPPLADETDALDVSPAETVVVLGVRSES